MKPALTRYALAALLAAPSLLAACGGESGTVETECKMAVNPGAVALGMLCVDGESQATFNVLNSGSAECIVNLEMGGVAPQHFAISTTQVTVPPGGSAPVTVTYHPAADGGALAGEHHFARVKLSSNAKENPDYEVSVDGETAATESKAILSLSCADSVKNCVNADPTEACCRVVDQAGLDEEPYYGRSYLTQVEFGAVQTGRTVTVPLKVTNLGCGQLDLSALNFAPITGTGYCGASSVAVVTPLPVSVAGSVSAQTRQSAEVEIQFTPSELCAYAGTVTVDSNDPDISADNPQTYAYGRFSVSGAGTEGRVRTFPTAWYFGDVGVGETVTQVFNINNVGTRAAEVSSLALRSAPGVYQIVKVERPNCPAGSGATDIGVGNPFTLAATDNVSNCGEDQVDVTVSFTPNDAGKFENYLDVAYGEGTAVIPLTGASYPSVSAIPGSRIQFFGPQALLCDPRSCSLGDQPNGSCQGSCVSDADCYDGALCIGGTCGVDTAATCAETCSDAERIVRICNSGHAPLKFDDASQGGGLVITGPGGHDNPPPMHRPTPGIDDPARNNTPVFSIVDNGCADAAGNGKTLASNECCEASVHFLDIRNGGSPSGSSGLQAELHIYTNDPTYRRDDLADGLGIDIYGHTDPDFDPVARWTAYDMEAGPGSMNGPRMGRMAVIDASASSDPTCDVSDPNCTTSNPISTFEWTLVAVSGTGDYVTAMVGPIDLQNPNARCPSFINGGKCFEVVDLGAQTGKVIRFYPDGEYARNYTFRLKVTDNVCSPPHQGILEQDIQVGAGG